MNFINMDFRKSTLLLLLVALTIFVSLSAISATDVNNDTVKVATFSNEGGEIDGGAIYTILYPKIDSIAVENSTNNTNSDMGQIPAVNDGNSTNNTNNDKGQIPAVNDGNSTNNTKDIRQITSGKNIIDKNNIGHDILKDLPNVHDVYKKNVEHKTDLGEKTFYFGVTHPIATEYANGSKWKAIIIAPIKVAQWGACKFWNWMWSGGN